MTSLPIVEIAKSTPAIIKEAQQSPLGIAALAIIAGALLIAWLLHRQKAWAIVTVLLALIVAVVLEFTAIARTPRSVFWFSGTLRNASDDKPITDAAVTLEFRVQGTNVTMVDHSDSLGKYSFELPDSSIVPLSLSVAAKEFRPNPFSIHLNGKYVSVPEPLSLSPETGDSGGTKEAFSTIRTSTSELPTGSVTLYDGFTVRGQNAFDFATQKIRPWGEMPADIGVANPPPATGKALFFLNFDSPPYTNPIDPSHEPRNAGIIQMSGTFDSITEAPTTGYLPHYVSPTTDGVYCVRTHDGQHYAKIRVTVWSQDRVSFDYVYQANGTRNLATK